MSEFATLLQAIAALLWPIFAFTTLLIFRKQIVELLKRLKRGKLLGQEIELNESLEALNKSAESVEQEVAALPAPVTSQTTAIEQAPQEEDTVRLVLSEAAKSPKAALILLASELEKLALQILASTGHLQGRRFMPIRRSIEELQRTLGLPAHVQSSLNLFWNARNRLVHGGEGTDEDILRAVDSGITILKSLQALPRETNIVYEPSVPVYVDSGLTVELLGARGIILETTAPGGATKSLRIFPTTRTHFQKGKQVAWEWNMQQVFPQAWYRHPVTQIPEEAWSSAAEFVGRHLDELHRDGV
ncbi:MAG: hypothetical protein CVU30_14130 [Betaproteobacteria bacterium HGW-Betaproteobacteria-3]|nr:MAG: hypothetical protein CVU30_14130 [Betaproteobacteria bacterium HGW-Betaproteobacteria-3]